MQPRTIEAADERFLSFPEVQRRIGYTRQHLSRLEKEGQFPKRVQIGPGRVGWPLSEVLAFIEQKKAARTAA